MTGPLVECLLVWIIFRWNLGGGFSDFLWALMEVLGWLGMPEIGIPRFCDRVLTWDDR